MAALEVVIGMVILALLALGGFGWIAVIGVLSAGGTVLPCTPRRQVPWGGLDLLVVLVIFVVATTAAVAILLPHYNGPEKLTAAEALGLLWADALSKLAVMATAIVYLIFVRGATRRDQGWTMGPVGRFIPLGFAAFVLLAPIVFAIQAALVQLGGWESNHPLIELVKTLRSVPIFATAFFATVIVAPLTEEWLFRVVLQGWLEKLFSGLATAEDILGLPKSKAPHMATVVEETPSVPTAERTNPYDPPVTPPTRILADTAVSPSHPLRTWPPILISAALFALAHLGHGPDFIPLFVFAVGLGLVYQRTHSIVPSLIVHLCLNLTSMVILGLQVFK